MEMFGPYWEMVVLIILWITEHSQPIIHHHKKINAKNDSSWIMEHWLLIIHSQQFIVIENSYQKIYQRGF